MNTTTKTGLALAMSALAALSLAGGPGKARGLDDIAELKRSGFTENKGQWDARALFLQSSPGKDVWVTKKGFTIDLYRLEKDPTAKPGLEASLTRSRRPLQANGIDQMRRVGHVVTIDYAGSNPGATSEGSSQLPRRIDFIKPGKDQQLFRTSAYKEAYVNNLYPGIHLRNYTDGGAYRFDLMVMPGASPSQIKMDVKGADEVSLDAKGNLVITTSIGSVRQTLPFVYQQVGAERVQVPASYKVVDGRVSFILGQYDKALPLVIDPLVYGSYVGADAIAFFSNGQDITWDGVADSRGNMYLSGQTSAINFPVLDGPYGFALKGSSDAFLVRMAGDAYALDYAAYIGGTGNEAGFNVALSENSSTLWMGGLTTSTDFPGNTDVGPGGTTMYYIKFTVVGGGDDITPMFSRYYTRPGPTGQWTGMATDSAGNLFLAGTADASAIGTGSPQAANFPAFHPQSVSGSADGFIQRVAPTGVLGAARRISGPFEDFITGIDISPGGVIAISGDFGATISQDTQNLGTATAAFPTTPGVYREGQLVRNGDAFVVTMNTVLALRQSALVGGASQDFSSHVAIDRRNDVYLLALTRSFDYPRTRGVYDEVFTNNPSFGDGAVTKLNANLSALVYSTGLRYQESVLPRRIDVDQRGVAVIGGLVTHRYPGGAPPQATIPGAIVTTPDALDAAYTGGNESVNPPNQSTGATAFNSSSEGYVQFLNPTGTNVLYCSYIGDIQNEDVTSVYVDSTGSAWVVGWTQVNPRPDGVTRPLFGIPPYITPNAFRVNTNALDGWVIKLRVGLPILSSVSFNPNSIPGGLGANSTATITLRAPAPAEGVVVTCTLTNPTVTSFTADGSSSTTTVTIPAGQASATVPVFSKAVDAPTSGDLRVTLDNDFLLARLAISPWFQDLSISPASIVGGNNVNIVARLFQNTPVDVSIPLTTSNSTLLRLPAQAQILVPAGANIGTLSVPTTGVHSAQTVSVNGTLLGTPRSNSVVINRANLAAVVFTPGRVLAGQGGRVAIQLDGQVGSIARTVRLTQTGGTAGITVNGRPLPTNVTFFPFTGPTIELPFATASTPAPSSAVITATEGTRTVSSTLFVDETYAISIRMTPSDVTGGEENSTVAVSIDRPAPPGGLTINLTSSHPTIASLNRDSVLIPQGATVPDAATPVTLTTSRTALDQVVTVRGEVSALIFGTGLITVRAPGVSALTLTPSTVTGPAPSTGRVSIAFDAPVGGLLVSLSSSDTTVATVPANVRIPAGATSATFPITTRSVAADTSVVIRGNGSSTSMAATLTVLSVGFSTFTFNPSAVRGGSNSVGTVRLNGAAPAGGLRIRLESDLPSVARPVVTEITIPAGQTTGLFTANTFRVSRRINVGFTATVIASGKQVRGFLGVDP